MRRLAGVTTGLTVLVASSAGAQTATSQVDVTVGYSTDRIAAAATQGRVFGEAKGLRFFVEGAWAKQTERESDAFGAAYPYEGARAMEVYGEKILQPGRYLAAVRAGRYRTPFGIYNASDHAYTGFLRAPLIRYDDYFGLSNMFLEAGVDVVIGIPHLSVEASAGVPNDASDHGRRGGLDKVVRVQGYHGDWVVGVSHINTLPLESLAFAQGRTTFTGVDVRWMRNGIQLRGEWMAGAPFDRARTRGGYLDVIVHRPAMGSVTAVARVEMLDYLAGHRSSFSRRVTTGARVRISKAVTAHVNLLRDHDVAGHGGTALDVALTFTARR
jgi:hypothetical protein